MRFVFPFPHNKGLRISRNPSEWPLALRFALLTMPIGICLALGATWLGYRASNTPLHLSLESLPLLEAKMQATEMEKTFSQLRANMERIAKNTNFSAQFLRENMQLLFQHNADLIQEISYRDINGMGFFLLRDKNNFLALTVAEASIGTYSPFQQFSLAPVGPGHAALYPPVYFDDTSGGQAPESKTPVMRLALGLEQGAVLMVGIDIARFRERLAASMREDSPTRLSMYDGSMQLSFFFDTKGWILFEMNNSSNSSFLPDTAREGYTGDLGRAGYDAAFRPWAIHENFWRMVTEVSAGRSGSISAPADKYAASHMGATGFLCFTPVMFRASDNGPSVPVGGIAFFQTSSLPMSAFLRLANYVLSILVISLVVFGAMALWTNYKIGRPMRRMASDLNQMVAGEPLDFITTQPGCDEQQQFQSAVNSFIALTMNIRNNFDQLTTEMQHARSRLPVDLSIPQISTGNAEYGLVGSSPLIREVREHVRTAARAGTDVLVWGETGTGKELVAAAIHKAGSTSKGPYVSINCGALDENLLLDALFGHVKGAFSEAKNDRKGAFLAADGGTLHLDEIANASLKVQQSLLRALSVRRIRPLGTDQEIPFNTRVVAATNVDLRDCVRAGTFREDLYFRLAIISVETPPLRHRKDDIPELAAHCIREAALALGRPEARLSRGVLELMTNYDWPGNVREFKNCLTRAMAYVEGDLILRQHITLEQDAFRTYSKPIAIKVLAEKIHPAAVYTTPHLPDSRPPSSRYGAEEQGMEPRTGQAQSEPPRINDIGYATEQLWPAPPREIFVSPAQGAPAPAFTPPPPQSDVSREYSSPPTQSAPLPVAPPRMAQPEFTPPAPGAVAELDDTMSNLNERQVKALAFVRTAGEMTRAQYEAVAAQGVSSRTAQNDLRELVERGILIRVGAGPGTRYTPGAAS